MFFYEQKPARNCEETGRGIENLYVDSLFIFKCRAQIRNARIEFNWEVLCVDVIGVGITPTYLKCA